MVVQVTSLVAILAVLTVDVDGDCFVLWLWVEAELLEVLPPPGLGHPRVGLEITDDVRQAKRAGFKFLVEGTLVGCSSLCGPTLYLPPLFRAQLGWVG